VWQNVHPIANDLGDRLAVWVRRHRLVESAAFHAIAPRMVDRLLEVPETGPRTAADLIVVLTEALPGASVPVAESFRRLAERTQSGELAGGPLDSARDRLRETLAALLDARTPSPVHHAAVLLAATWQEPAGLRAAAGLFGSNDTETGLRLSMLDALIAARDPAALDLVAQVLKEPERNAASFRGDVISSLGRLDDPAAAKVLLDHYAGLEPPLRPRVIELLTQRDVWAEPLLAAVARKEIPAEVINLNQIRRLLAAGGGRFTPLG
jgi:hypothetical protein